MNIIIDRKEWLRIARERLKSANDGTSKMRKQKIKRSSITSNFVDKAPTIHIEQDIQQFIKAAEAFEIAGRWKEAAEAYAKTGSMYLFELKAFNNAALLYTEAGLVAERFDGNKINGAKEYFQKAISIYCDCRKYKQAARLRKWIAESYELESQRNRDKKEAAISQFQMAIQYFRAAEMDFQVLECQRKVCNLLASSGKDLQAFEAYKELARNELRFNLTKYSVVQSLFRATLLSLATEDVDLGQTKVSLEDFMKLDFRFEISVCAVFLKNIIKVIGLSRDQNSVDEFADHIFDYNELYPFGEVELGLLERIYLNHFQ